MNDNNKLVIPGVDPIADALDQKRRADNCKVDLQNVLQRWNCTIGPIVTITARGSNMGYEIIPLVNVGADKS